MTRMLLLLAALTGCGDWVEYEGAPPAATPPDTSGDDVDDALADIGALPRQDHLIFQGLLSRYVVLDGHQSLVDYDRWAVNPEAVILFRQYRALLAGADPTALATREEKMAFWFNAYNALTIHGVLSQYEGDAEWSVSRNLFAFFKEKRDVVAGLQLSLDQIEHGVMRGATDHDAVRDESAEVRAQLAAWHADLWADGDLDPRLHVAINCASLGCPNLLLAFTGAELEKQLAEATRAFVDSPEKGAGPDGISQLFTWFEPDFSRAGYTGPASFIARWRTGGTDGVDLDARLPYAWDLNRLP